jgi:ribulose-phosphate 3-epimerase
MGKIIFYFESKAFPIFKTRKARGSKGKIKIGFLSACAHRPKTNAKLFCRLPRVVARKKQTPPGQWEHAGKTKRPTLQMMPACRIFAPAMRKHLIAPSVLAADFTKLAAEIDLVNGSEADWFHLDVMDGRFVPNITFGMMVVEAIHKLAQKPLDVHLMIEEPEKYIEAFRKAGAQVISVHCEVCPHLHRTIGQIKETGAQAGVALNPATPVSVLEDVIEDIDLVVLMSVNPGFGGQKFIYRTLEKVRALRALIDARNAKTLIEIDGGVGLHNAEALLQAGADVLVAGNSVFGAKDPQATIAALKSFSPVFDL